MSFSDDEDGDDKDRDCKGDDKVGCSTEVTLIVLRGLEFDSTVFVLVVLLSLEILLL